MNNLYRIENEFYAATRKFREKYLLTLYELRFKEGVSQGQKEAQRIFRLEIAPALKARNCDIIGMEVKA